LTEFLLSIDVAIFFFVNHTLQNGVFDVLMPWITDLNKHLFVIIVVFGGLLWMIIRGNSQTRTAAIVLILTIIISDQLNSSWLKFLFERVRPCRTLEHVHLLVGCGSGYSFPSSHAVNNFAGAAVLSFFFRRQTWMFMTFAAVVAFSRVYVGVHYPSDVVGGGIIGAGLGGAVCFLYQAGKNRIQTLREKEETQHDDVD
jgi:undecaprenyl-diphosphatase